LCDFSRPRKLVINLIHVLRNRCVFPPLWP